MKSRSLVWQLTLVQVLVVAVACTLLVAGVMAASAVMLRREQDNSLRTEASAICNAIVEERLEEGQGMDNLDLELEEMGEATMEGFRAELLDREGSVLAAHGELAGWSGITSAPVVGTCASLNRGGTWSEPLRYRLCSERCEAGRAVRVITLDVLAEPWVYSAALGTLAALPLAVLAGAVVGVVVFRRMLRPLEALRSAAARLEPQRALTLGVGAAPAELAALERAFDSLLNRLGEALAREKRFTQEASHELRTPLTILRGRLEHLRAQVSGQPDLKAETDAAILNLESLDRLVDALLVLARSESAGLPQTPVNLCDLARHVAAHGTGEGAGAGAMPPPIVDAPDEILVRGSEELLDRALANLIENSRKFGGSRTRIVIRVRQENGQGVIRVEDDGPGIPAELRPFVFERFVRGAADRNRVPGTGLGLAVVRAIVLRHGGEVSTGPAALGGEEVRLSLPLLILT